MWKKAKVRGTGEKKEKGERATNTSLTVCVHLRSLEKIYGKLRCGVTANVGV